MANFTAYLMSEDAKAQAEFYIQALGGKMNSITRHGDLPNASEDLKDKVINLSFMAAGVHFMMSDSVLEPVSYGNTVNLNLEFAEEAEARQAFDNLAEGGVVKEALNPAFWGALFGHVQDKFGILWMITTVPKQEQQ
ncbi:VOC family protein [Paenibacillus sp. sgz5001063]|uniref:VOC family protein n=1 Tax=Paenibacillus sp. sgz5001063 TaxID=3242474 RepID=UPI0036D3E99B